MRKRHFLLLAVAIASLTLNGCSGGGTTDVDTSQTESVAESESSEAEPASTVEMPEGFTKITQEQAESCPDGDGVVEVMKTALQSIGVKKVPDCYWGNYKAAGSVVDMEAYLITDAQNLIVRCQYLNNNWTVVYITDSENGHLYYPTTGKDAYNYTTGELIKQEETTEPAAVEDTQEESKEPETQEVPHRDGMYGISDKSCHDIDATFSRDKVRNDVTGKWRVSAISADVQMVEYAKDYYQWKFTNDDEIHCIVNFYNNTTTKIQYLSGNLFVTVHEYVKGEEHDANLMFSGTVLQDFIVYLDNGDIEQIQ